MGETGNPPAEAEAALKPLDEAVVGMLIENQKAFLGFLRKRLPSRDIAEDMLQQSLLKAIKHGHDLQEKESVIPWFYRILRNMTTDFYRSRAAEERKTDSFGTEAAELAEDRIPEEMREGICACMNDLIPVLKPGYAELIRRIDLEGGQPALIAEELAITYGNLMVRLHRARQALRISLERACGACTRHGCLDCTCQGKAGTED